MSDIKPLTLYAIDAELQALEDALLASGGEITDEIEAQHNDLLDLRTGKVEGYLRVLRRLEATAEAVKAERQRLQEAERRFATAAQSLKSRLAWSMQQRGETEHPTALGRVKLQRSSSPPVELTAEVGSLPDAFVRVKRSADLTALRDALQSDDPDLRAEAERVAHLGEATYYVRIY
ncbi:MAG: siphovirus Gp157 family protein [Bacteroidota bacterium]